MPVDDAEVIGAITRDKEVGMRSILKKSVMLAVVFLGLAGAAANAAASDVLEAKVPFPFVVNGRNFPAGQYRVERMELSRRCC